MVETERKRRGEELTLFGWWGITFLHPEDWAVSKLSGDDKKGEVLLDDGLLVRVELHWESPASAFSLERVISNHIKSVKREAKRKRLPFKIERNIKLPSKRTFKDRNGEFFIWESDYRAFSLIWYCKVCGKLVLMRIFSKKGEHVEELVRKIYDSFTDHPTDDKLTWGLYSFIFRTPKDYQLNNYSLKSGYLKFIFNRERDRLLIERWALGNILLGDKNLKEWFCQNHRNECTFLSEEVNLEDTDLHTKLRFIFEKKRKMLIGRRKERIEGKVWYCKRSNRIFVLLSHSFSQRPSMLEAVGRELICHR
ncbi:MAG TPA: hypothetical protein EYP78_03065 [Candidatus Omnitrophica bacterium]|nr:hypothetical protein [Candidatus Omnitrophota bacterium]